MNNDSCFRSAAAICHGSQLCGPKCCFDVVETGNGAHAMNVKICKLSLNAGSAQLTPHT